MEGSTQTQNLAPGSALAGWAILMVILAVALLVLGLLRLYTYSASSDALVGGDAYNYIILTNRGVGLIAASVACAGVGSIFALLSIRVRLESR